MRFFSFKRSLKVGYFRARCFSARDNPKSMSDNLIDWLRWLSRLSIVQVNHTSNARRANRYFAALCIGSDARSSVAAGVNNQFCGDSSLPALVCAASATVRTISVASGIGFETSEAPKTLRLAINCASRPHPINSAFWGHKARRRVPAVE